MTNALPIDLALPDLGQWLRARDDYDTVYPGKWHVPGRNVAESFDYLHPGIGMGGIGDGDVGRAAAALLSRRDGGWPFLLSVGFLNPHDYSYTCGVGGVAGKFEYASRIVDELPPFPETFDPDLPWILDERRCPGGHWSGLSWRYYIYSCHPQTEMANSHVGLVYDASFRVPVRRLRHRLTRKAYFS